MWRKNILRDLRCIMEIKRRSIKEFREAAKKTRDRRWAKNFDMLASYEYNRLESVELAYENLVENNDWLVLRDLFDEGPKPMEIGTLKREVKQGKDSPDHETLKSTLEQGKKMVSLYEDIISDYEHSFKKGIPLMKWLKDQAQEYVDLLEYLKKGLKAE